MKAIVGEDDGSDDDGGLGSEEVVKRKETGRKGGEAEERLKARGKVNEGREGGRVE